MKVIITESRLNNVIESYLNFELGDLKLGRTTKNMDWYVNQSGRPIVIIFNRNITKNKNILSLRRDIYDNLEKMFGLDTTDDIQVHLKKYFNTKWEIPVNVVYTFDPSYENVDW
jgi:hypothetical protein